MTDAAPDWQTTTVTVDAKMDSGEVVTAENTPALEADGETYVDPDHIIHQKFLELVDSLGLDEARDLSLLSMLAAPAGELQATVCPYIYSMNKMLFYQWKRMEEQGLGDAFPRDDFVADRKGPVPEHIYEDLERLDEAGLISVDWPEKDEKEHRPVQIHLTSEGKDVAQKAYEEAEPWFSKTTQEVKTEIFPLKPDSLMGKVHTEYPEYVRDYVEVDDS